MRGLGRLGARVRSVSALLTVVLALAPAAAPTPSPGASAPGSAYVAMGDSYAAGFGLPDPTGEPVRACGQSAHDYPHQVAARLGLRLTDVSCATATTADLRSRSATGVPAQVAALGTGTRTVTLTIGGNDSRLFSQAFSCLALTAHGPVFAASGADDCRSEYVHDGTDTLRAEITGPIAGNLTRTFRAVRRAAPGAVIVVVGYPTIFPDPARTPAGGCFVPAITGAALTGHYPRTSFPFTDVDVRYFHGIQQALDDTTREAAQAAHVAYVSVLSRTAAHSACAADDPYVNGLELTSRTVKGEPTTDLEPGALHPNAHGAAALADAALQGVLAASRARGEAAAGGQAPHRAAGPPPWGLVAAAVVVVLIVAGGVTALLARRPGPRSGQGSSGDA